MSVCERRSFPKGDLAVSAVDAHEALIGHWDRWGQVGTPRPTGDRLRKARCAGLFGPYEVEGELDDFDLAEPQATALAQLVCDGG